MKFEKVIEAVNEKLESQDNTIYFLQKQNEKLKAELKKANEELATLRCGYAVDRPAYEVDEGFDNGKV